MIVNNSKNTLDHLGCKFVKSIKKSYAIQPRLRPNSKTKWPPWLEKPEKPPKKEDHFWKSRSDPKLEPDETYQLHKICRESWKILDNAESGWPTFPRRNSTALLRIKVTNDVNWRDSGFQWVAQQLANKTWSVYFGRFLAEPVRQKTGRAKSPKMQIKWFSFMTINCR